MSLISRLLNEYDRLNTIDKENTGEWNAVLTSILLVPIVIALYLIFVLHLGPKMMRNRRPFSLLYFVLGYDILQVIINVFLIIQYAYYLWLRRDSITCLGREIPGTSYFEWMVNIGWVAITSRLIDLQDTVFHVLRKKYSHITFLHVYHHALSVYLAWYGARYIPGGVFAVAAVWNCSVHAIMYAYYFASAHPSLRPHASHLKKRVTQLQLIQFLSLAPYAIHVFTGTNCYCHPKWFVLFALSQDVLMFLLFGRFYLRKYGKNKKEN